MKRLPDTQGTPFVRCDFSDQEAWERVRAAVARPGESEVVASVEVIEDPSYAGLTPSELIALLPEEHRHAILIVADKRTLTEADNPLLVIDLMDDPGREVRVIAEEAWSIEDKSVNGQYVF